MAIAKKAQKASEAKDTAAADLLRVDARSIRVIVDRMIDGYSMMVSMTEGQLTRVLAETTVATFVEAEKMACDCAAENNFPWHKVEVICR